MKEIKKARIGATFLLMADLFGNLSYANRRKVGCLIVKDGHIISNGYNGTLPGSDNNCEGEDGLTLPEVIHAEDNAMKKILKSTTSSEGASIYVTYFPCIRCSVDIVLAGISEVWVMDDYDMKHDQAKKFLEDHGIIVKWFTRKDVEFLYTKPWEKGDNFAPRESK